MPDLLDPASYMWIWYGVLKVLDPNSYKWVVDFVREHQTAAPFVIGFMGFLECLAIISLAAPMSIPLFLVGAAVGAVSGQLLITSMISCFVGGFLGYAVSYWIGLHFKDSRLIKWIYRRYPEKMSTTEKFFVKYGSYAVFFGHFSGPVRGFAPLFAGLTSMSQVWFQTLNFAAAAIWAVGIMSAGLISGNFVTGQAAEYIKYIGKLFGG